MHFYSPGLTFTFGSLSLSAPEVYVESYWRNPCIEYGRQKNENGKLKMLLWREDMLGRSEWVTCLSIFDLFLVSLRVGINNRNRRKSKHQGIQLRTWNFLFLVECSRKTWNFLFLSRNNNKQSLGSVFCILKKWDPLSMSNKKLPKNVFSWNRPPMIASTFSSMQKSLKEVTEEEAVFSFHSFSFEVNVSSILRRFKRLSWADKRALRR